MLARIKQKINNMADYLELTYEVLGKCYRNSDSNVKKTNVIDHVVPNMFAASMRRTLAFTYGDDAQQYDVTIRKDYIEGGHQVTFWEVLNKKELRLLNPCHFLISLGALLKNGSIEIADAIHRARTKSSALAVTDSSSRAKKWKGFVMVVAGIAEPVVYILCKAGGDLLDAVVLDRLSDGINYCCRRQIIVQKKEKKTEQSSESSVSSHNTTSPVIATPSVRLAVETKALPPAQVMTELALPGTVVVHLAPPAASQSGSSSPRLTSATDRRVAAALAARGQQPAVAPKAESAVEKHVRNFQRQQRRAQPALSQQQMSDIIEAVPAQPVLAGGSAEAVDHLRRLHVQRERVQVVVADTGAGVGLR